MHISPRLTRSVKPTRPVGSVRSTWASFRPHHVPRPPPPRARPRRAPALSPAVARDPWAWKVSRQRVSLELFGAKLRRLHPSLGLIPRFGSRPPGLGAQAVQSEAGLKAHVCLPGSASPPACRGSASPPACRGRSSNGDDRRPLASRLPDRPLRATEPARRAHSCQVAPLVGQNPPLTRGDLTEAGPPGQSQPSRVHPVKQPAGAMRTRTGPPIKQLLCQGGRVDLRAVAGGSRWRPPPRDPPDMLPASRYSPAESAKTANRHPRTHSATSPSRRPALVVAGSPASRWTKNQPVRQRRLVRNTARPDAPYAPPVPTSHRACPDMPEACPTSHAGISRYASGVLDQPCRHIPICLRRARPAMQAYPDMPQACPTSHAGISRYASGVLDQPCRPVRIGSERERASKCAKATYMYVCAQTRGRLARCRRARGYPTVPAERSYPSPFGTYVRVRRASR